MLWKRSASQVWSQAREQARTDHREQVDQEASPGKRLELTAEVPSGANVGLDVLRRVCLVQMVEYPTVPWRASAGVRQGEFSCWMTIRHGHATTADVDSGRAAGKDAKRNHGADRLARDAEFGAFLLALTRCQDQAQLVAVTQRMAHLGARLREPSSPGRRRA